MESVFFLGACTPKGFVSHYDSLLQEAKHVTVIKGGSGCGKSTFMRAIGKAAKDKALQVSYILCSSDPESLDGIYLPELSLSYVDGTAPHVLEPKLCGGSMNYLNFGVFYDSAAMEPNEEEILEAQRKNAAQYPYVTACLTAAKQLMEGIHLASQEGHYDQELSAIAECLSLSALKPVGDKGFTARRFLSALTPKGLHFCSRTPALLCHRVYVLKDNYFLAPRVLQILLSRAESYGHRCIACYRPLLPEGAPTHLLLPEAGVAFVSENCNFPYNGPCFCRIDLDSTLPPQTRKELDYYSKTLTSLLYQSVSHLREAKRHHDRMEQLCRPFVDFRAVNAMTEETIEKLFA